MSRSKVRERIIALIGIIPVLLITCVWAAVELDVDNNGALDVDKGGTNSTTAAGARTALGVAATSHTQAISTVTNLQTTLDGKQPVMMNASTLARFGAGPTYNGSPIGSGHDIEDEGIGVTQRSTINFTGAGVTVTDEAGKTTVAIPSGGGVSSFNSRTGTVVPDASDYASHYSDKAVMDAYTSVGGGRATVDEVAATYATKAQQPKLFISESTIPIRASSSVYLAVSPNAGHIIAATSRYIYRSTDGGTTWGTAPIFDLGEDAMRCMLLWEDSSGNIYFSWEGGTNDAVSTDKTGVYRLTKANYDVGNYTQAYWVKVVGPAASTDATSRPNTTEFSAKTWTVNHYAYPTSTKRNGMLYKVTVASSASTTEPVWPMIKGKTVTSGGTTFECVGMLDWLSGSNGYGITEPVAGTIIMNVYHLGLVKGHYVLRSTDAGVTWTDVTTAEMNVPWRQHAHQLITDNTSPTKIVYMGVGEMSPAASVWADLASSVVIHTRVRISDSSKMFRALNAGTKGAEPSWASASTVGDTVTDGAGIVWEYLGDPRWADGNALIMKSTDAGATWSTDWGITVASFFDDAAGAALTTTPSIAGSVTSMLPIGNDGTLIAQIERQGFSDIYKRTEAGSFTRVLKEATPVDTVGTEPIEVGDTPAMPTSYWRTEGLAIRQFSTSDIFIFYLWKAGYRVSRDNGDTWSYFRQIGNQWGGGVTWTSNIHPDSDRVMLSYRSDTGQNMGYWSVPQTYDNAIILDVATSKDIDVSFTQRGFLVTEDVLGFSDTTAGNATVDKHGLMPKIGTGLTVTDGVISATAGEGSGTTINGTASGALPFYDGDSWEQTDGAGTDGLFWDDTNKRVGIGTNAPTNPLHIVGSTALGVFERNSADTSVPSNIPSFVMQNPNTTDNNTASFNFNGYQTGSAPLAYFIGAQVTAVFTDHTKGAESTELAFVTRDSGTRTEKLRLNASGAAVSGLKIDHATAAEGYVWTATDADGNGQWEAFASGMQYSTKVSYGDGENPTDADFGKVVVFTAGTAHTVPQLIGTGTTYTASPKRTLLVNDSTADMTIDSASAGDYFNINGNRSNSAWTLGARKSAALVPLDAATGSYQVEDILTGSTNSIGAGDTSLTATDTGTGNITATVDTATSTVTTAGKFGVGLTPAFPVDITGNQASNPTSQLHISANNSSDGAYLTSIGTSTAQLSGGMERTAGAWTARATSGSVISATSGGVTFSGDNSLTIGNTFTPTTRVGIRVDGGFRIYGSTEAGTVPDPAQPTCDANSRGTFWFEKADATTTTPDRLLFCSHTNVANTYDWKVLSTWP